VLNQYSSQRKRLCAGVGIEFRLLVNVSQIYRFKLRFYSFAQLRFVELELKLNSSTKDDGEIRQATLAQNPMLHVVVLCQNYFVLLMKLLIFLL
jgi:hypothetical protein